MASAHAVGAQAPLAALAIRTAFTAEVRVATVAAATVVLVGQAAAVLAAEAVPIGEFHVPAAAGVGADQA